MFVSINGKHLYVWRAVDSEGEVLDILVQPRRDRNAALKLMRKLLKKQGITPATALRYANSVLRGGTTQVAGRIIQSAIATTRTTNEALQVT